MQLPVLKSILEIRLELPRKATFNWAIRWAARGLLKYIVVGSIDTGYPQKKEIRILNRILFILNGVIVCVSSLILILKIYQN